MDFGLAGITSREQVKEARYYFEHSREEIERFIDGRIKESM